MHTGSRSAARLVASAVAISSLVAVASPAAADDHQADLVWVTAHDEPQPSAFRAPLEVAPDGSWAVVSIDPAFSSTEEEEDHGGSYLSDLSGGPLTPLDGWVRSISDSGRIAVFVEPDWTFSVVDLTTGWTRDVAPGEALDEVAVSGDGSTLLLSFHAEDVPEHVVATEPVAGGERTTVSTVAGGGYNRISHDGSTVVFQVPNGETSTVQRWRDGSTVAVGDGQVFAPSDDLGTIPVRHEDGSVAIWDDGAVTTLDANPGAWLSVAVSGDGSAVAWLSDEGLVRRDLATGDDELLAALPYEVDLLALALDADGDTIAYEPILSPGEVDLHLWREGRGTEVVCCDDSHSATRSARTVLLSDDGSTVVFSSDHPIAPDDPDEGSDEVFAWHVDAPPREGVVSISDVYATEGERWGIGVHLTRPVDHDVTVVVEVENGTADADDWTVADDLELVIPAGEEGAEVEATFWADTEDEPSETATLRIVSADVGIERGVADVHIENAAPAEVSIGDVRRQEWASAQYWKFPITTSAYAREVAVTLTTRDGGDPLRNAMAGVDYVTTQKTVTIPMGSRTGQLVVQVNGDVVPELDETFTVEATAVRGAVLGDGVGLGTIKDDDPQVALPVRFA